jgi:hypothetical protein
MSIPFDALSGSEIGIISAVLFVGMIGIMLGVEALMDRWRNRRS